MRRTALQMKNRISKEDIETKEKQKAKQWQINSKLCDYIFTDNPRRDSTTFYLITNCRSTITKSCRSVQLPNSWVPMLMTCHEFGVTAMAMATTAATPNGIVSYLCVCRACGCSIGWWCWCCCWWWCCHISLNRSSSWRIIRSSGWSVCAKCCKYIKLVYKYLKHNRFSFLHWRNAFWNFSYST